jgi:hypothetical protein
MAQIYTKNQIVNYLYGECDLFERLETEFAIEDCPSFADIFYKLKASKDNLELPSISPSVKSIDRIMAYSRMPMVNY